MQVQARPRCRTAAPRGSCRERSARRRCSRQPPRSVRSRDPGRRPTSRQPGRRAKDASSCPAADQQLIADMTAVGIDQDPVPQSQGGLISGARYAPVSTEERLRTASLTSLKSTPASTPFRHLHISATPSLLLPERSRQNGFTFSVHNRGQLSRRLRAAQRQTPIATSST